MTGITEDELKLIEALVNSPAFAAFKKLYGIQAETEKANLLTATKPEDIYRLQGRIQGIMLIEKLPEFIAKSLAEKLKKRAEQENDPRPKSAQFRPNTRSA